ncbi:MAG TPA: MFS transporter [Amnibacterium sp.]|uniref:MFS transporter n=1 Tax=Amnibacterium sp. TaxID=1872496 RepID=UPI002F93DA3D
MSATIHPTVSTSASSAPPARTWRDSFSSLSVRNFRLFAGANILAMTATWMQRVAQDWLVLQLTGSVADVGVTVAMQFGPMLVFGLYGGVIVDRYSKRKLLMISQSTVGLLSAVIAILALTGTATVWAVWATALGVGLATVVDNPARQVFVNELVGPTHLRNAITINSGVFQLGGLIGPAVSGALIAAIGGGFAFAVNALACAVTVFMLTRLDVSALTPITPAPRSRGQLKEGVQYAAARPAIRWPIVLVGFLAVFTITMPVLLASYAKNVFDQGAAGYGLFNSLVAGGALVGALLTTRRTVIRLRTVIVCGGVWAVVQAIAALMPSEVAFGVALVGIGIANQYFFMAANPLIQTTSSTRVRGRVMAVWILVLLGGQGIGGPVMGWIVDAIGPRDAMFLSGAVPALAAVAIAVLIARQGALTLKMQWRTPLHPVAIQQR